MTKISRTGKAVVLDKPNGQFFIKNYPVPEPQKGTLLIKQEMCGICGSDAHMYRGDVPDLPFPMILGHEIAGRIDKLGEGISTDIVGKHVSEGDRIVLIPALLCGKCYYCKILKEPTSCLNELDYGFMGPADKEPYFQGGYAEYIYAASPLVEFLKTDLPSKIASLLEPFTMGIRCAERARMGPGDTVVIQGSGPIGLFNLIAAKESNVIRTIVIGGPKQRLALAKKLGADVVIDISEMTNPQERVKMVKEQTPNGLGADVVVECTGFPAAVPEGIDMLRRLGTYVEVGHFSDNGTCQINPYFHLVQKQATIISVFGSETRHFVKGLPILESGKYPFEDFVSHVLPLEKVMDGIRAITTGYKINGEDVVKIGVSSEI
ncbi:MAG TPA: zinc-binding dehydrogenase [Candidatus Acidoferrum sp.]|nr:zinc-binding dehydrogenase [Candidatus Acidoferrum sp.]